jgi:hypothetical protein
VICHWSYWNHHNFQFPSGQLLVFCALSRSDPAFRERLFSHGWVDGSVCVCVCVCVRTGTRVLTHMVFSKCIWRGTEGVCGTGWTPRGNFFCICSFLFCFVLVGLGLQACKAVMLAREPYHQPILLWLFWVFCCCCCCHCFVLFS